MKKLHIAFCFLLVFYPCLAFAATVDFGWDANTEQDLAGYRLYQATTSGSYTKGTFIAEIPKPAVAYSLAAVPDGTYFWVLTAFDQTGNESGWSNEVTATIDETAPAPPSGFWALIKKIIAWLKGGFGATVKG